MSEFVVFAAGAVCGALACATALALRLTPADSGLRRRESDRAASARDYCAERETTTLTEDRGVSASRG